MAPDLVPPADQLGAEAAHWRQAIEALADLESVASPEAWSGLEHYLRLQVRERLLAVVAAVGLEAAQLERALAAGIPPVEGRARMLRLRSRYLQVETILDFYGDAVGTRTNPALASLLRGLDRLAGDSLAALLGPLGIDAPPVLVYLDKGLGASILRAGVRLWDQANPSPAAAVKLTRHNLAHPTALFHESGHQFAHLTGWTAELADALRATASRRSTTLGELWGSWGSEVAADVHAFALCGWTPLPALANVVDGPTASVVRILPGDPHPFPLVRVLFNAALCRSWYGPGPWDDVARTWIDRHLGGDRPAEGARLARLSLEVLGDLVDVCTRRPMAAFRGRPLHQVADPRRASPAALAALARQAGPSLLTSTYLARREPVRILSWLVHRTLNEPGHVHSEQLRRWISDQGDETPSVRTARAA
jgi:hypothetical protein